MYAEKKKSKQISLSVEGAAACLVHSSHFVEWKQRHGLDSITVTMRHDEFLKCLL